MDDGGDMLVANPNHRGADWPSTDSDEEDGTDEDSSGEEQDEEDDDEDDEDDYEVDRLGNRVAKTKLVA